MILIVVYVGAVAVLFLFVVMMLDVDFVELRQGFLTYLPFAAVLGFVFLVELISVGSSGSISSDGAQSAGEPDRRQRHEYAGARARALHALRLLL